jgi:hypothetical protein
MIVGSASEGAFRHAAGPNRRKAIRTQVLEQKTRE